MKLVLKTNTETLPLDEQIVMTAGLHNDNEKAVETAACDPWAPVVLFTVVSWPGGAKHGRSEAATDVLSPDK